MNYFEENLNQISKVDFLLNSEDILFWLSKIKIIHLMVDNIDYVDYLKNKLYSISIEKSKRF